MSIQRSAGMSPETDAEGGVENYLLQHPDFFERHLPLLGTLRLPHPSGAAVSLVERQVSLLREQNAQLKQKLVDLVNIARENDRLTERMHRLSLALMEAGTLDQILQSVEEALRNDFQADVVVLRLFGTVPEATRPRGEDPASELFPDLLKSRRPLCGRLKSEQLEYLFAGRAREVGSAAVVALGQRCSYGLLALGSEDPKRFHSGLGKVYLSHLGELVSAALRSHVGTGAL